MHIICPRELAHPTEATGSGPSAAETHLVTREIRVDRRCISRDSIGAFFPRSLGPIRAINVP